MTQAKNGDEVTVHYSAKLEDGTEFDTTRDSDPLRFKIGSENVIPGFEESIIGMKIGDKKNVTIQPDNAYGQWRKELILNIQKSDFPENINPEVGKRLQIRQRDGQPINVVIADMKEDTVILDANHPLAGKALVFDIELIEIE